MDKWLSHGSVSPSVPQWERGFVWAHRVQGQCSVRATRGELQHQLCLSRTAPISVADSHCNELMCSMHRHTQIQTDRHSTKWMKEITLCTHADARIDNAEYSSIGNSIHADPRTHARTHTRARKQTNKEPSIYVLQNAFFKIHYHKIHRICYVCIFSLKGTSSFSRKNLL